MILDKSTVVLIPCAGKGSRSKLPYPKSLFKVKNKTILIKIIEIFNKFNLIYKIIINKKNFKLFVMESKNYLNRIEFIYQNNPLGMGDAILQFKKSKNYNEIKNVILIWGDVPFIKFKTLDILIKKHFNNKNDFTFISGMSRNPYTIVKRNKLNKVTSVIEMKNININININKNKNKNKISNYVERDIGVFIFNKKKVINSLLKIKEKHDSKNEMSFLKVISVMNSKGLKIEALNIATKQEMKSLNYIKDLK